MKNLNIVIFYKDNSYKIIPVKNINTSLLDHKNIKLILIPLYDNPNSYIPIKPAYLYNFKKAIVSITYQAFLYEVDEDLGTSFAPNLFYKECNNFIDFINAIYNVYKFRGVTLYLSDNTIVATGMMTFVISIRHINIKFFNNNNQLINEIDSGIMKDLSEYKKKYFWKIPPQYTNEGRIKCLKDILYIPESYDNKCDSELDKLPLCIHLQNDDTWKKINKPHKELIPSDYILYKIPDFEVYYMMQYDVYLQLIGFKSFQIHYVSTPIVLGYDRDFLTSLDTNKIPSFMEKEEAIDAYVNGDLFSISNTCAEIKSNDIFFQSLIFANTILNYIKYFALYCYAGESSNTKIRSFLIFGKAVGFHHCEEVRGEILLTDLEMNYDNIIEAFLNMIMKGE